MKEKRPHLMETHFERREIEKLDAYQSFLDEVNAADSPPHERPEHEILADQFSQWADYYKEGRMTRQLFTRLVRNAIKNHNPEQDDNQ